MLCVLAAAPAMGAAAEDSPTFPNITLTDLEDGSAVEFESFRGRPVLVTFWASWCGPCRWELPELQGIYDDFADEGFELVAVNVDSSPQMARRYLENMELSIPSYRVGRRDLAMLGLRSIPTNVLVGPDGRPVQMYTGYSEDVAKDIRRRVAEMVETPAGDDDRP